MLNLYKKINPTLFKEQPFLLNTFTQRASPSLFGFNLHKSFSTDGDFEFDFYRFQKEDPSEIESHKDKINPEKTYHLYCTGYQKRPKLPCSSAYSIYDEEGNLIHQYGAFTGLRGRDIAQYQSLLFGLKTAQTLGIKNIKIMTNAVHIIKHYHGEWEIRFDGLIKYVAKTKEDVKAFDNVEFVQVNTENPKCKESFQLCLDTIHLRTNEQEGQQQKSM